MALANARICGWSETAGHSELNATSSAKDCSQVALVWQSLSVSSSQFDPMSEDRIKKVENRVDSLEKRIATLENRMKGIEVHDSK